GVKCALSGETGKVMVFRRVNEMPYTIVIETTSAANIANNEKFLPDDFITPSGNNISDSALNYFLPLIQGELNVVMEQVIPKHFAIQESVLK
ncbi:MAG: 6-phosphofructokinase, partial [Ruminococcus sp.]|nr:6-phosphofructokinase [Ruminococcus sp.]